jgi:hypothetical protein
VLIRMDSASVEQKWARMRALIHLHGEQLPGAYSVVQERRFRIRRLDEAL